MVTVAEAAARIGRSPSTVRRWVREGRVRTQRVSGKQLIEEGDVRAIEDELYPMAELPDEWKTGDGPPHRRSQPPRTSKAPANRGLQTSGENLASRKPRRRSSTGAGMSRQRSLRRRDIA